MKKMIACLLVVLLFVTATGCNGTDKRIYGYWTDDYGSTTYGFGGNLQGFMGWQGMSLPIVYMLKGEILYIAFVGNEDLETLNASSNIESAVRSFIESNEKKIEYGITFFGDNEFVLESPPQSGEAMRYKRQTQESSY